MRRTWCLYMGLVWRGPGRPLDVQPYAETVCGIPWHVCAGVFWGWRDLRGFPIAQFGRARIAGDCAGERVGVRDYGFGAGTHFRGTLQSGDNHWILGDATIIDAGFAGVLGGATGRSDGGGFLPEAGGSR